MLIEVIKVPQYSSKNVNVIMIDSKPFCTCRGKQNTQKLVSLLQGYDIKIFDARIIKKLNEIRGVNNE